MSCVALHGPARGLRAARAASDVGSKSPFVRGARFAVLREEGMGYLVAILSRGRAPQVVILSGAPPGAESKDPVWRQQKAPPSSTPRTRDRPPGSATEKHRPHPALAEIARYARFSAAAVFATWAFPFRLRKRPPEIVHSARSLPRRSSVRRRIDADASLPGSCGEPLERLASL